MDITVFTPTYNRIELLKGLYESILRSAQKLYNGNKVHWLIVDDGSTSDLNPVISFFDETDNLSISLIKKENGGKHTAFNVAIENCETELFVCIDDDDRLTDNALRDIITAAEKYKNSDYGAIVGRVVDSSGSLLGNTIFCDELVSNTIEIRDRYHFWGEPEVYFVERLKEFRFPVYENEKFVTEAYVFDVMSKKYPFIYTNIKMMVKEYLQGGLTDNNLKIRMNSPKGAEAYYYQRYCMCSNYAQKLKAAINRSRFVRCISWKSRPKRNCGVFELVAFPIGLLMHLKDTYEMRL